MSPYPRRMMCSSSWPACVDAEGCWQTRHCSRFTSGELGIPVLKHLHHVWPHYVTGADGERQLYLLVQGWSRGKFAVLKHEPTGKESIPNHWNRAQEPL